jgi:carbonic anhydrase
MDIKKVFENNEQWVAQKLGKNPDYFQNLAKSQEPDFLFIGCSDSRVPPAQLMGAEPGDVFVDRNIGNVICNTDANVLTVIDYAVNILKVNYLVICGHYGCGGVKAAMQGDDMGSLNPWLNHIRDVYHLHAEELNNIKDDEERYQRYVELNVTEQCINALKIPYVKQACLDKKLGVHGWVFDIKSGHIVDLNIDNDKLLNEIEGIY